MSGRESVGESTKGGAFASRVFELPSVPDVSENEVDVKGVFAVSILFLRPHRRVGSVLPKFEVP